MFNVPLEGALTWYGKAEYWKHMAQKLGYTKPTRIDCPDNKKRKKNDGWSPDTLDEIFGS